TDKHHPNPDKTSTTTHHTDTDINTTKQRDTGPPPSKPWETGGTGSAYLMEAGAELIVRDWQSGAMRPWNTSTEDDLRRLLNEWDPIAVAEDVQDEYDCMLAPLLQRLRSGAVQTEIGEFLRHELEEHFGLDSLGMRPDAMAVRVVDWWTSAGPAGDVASP
ncbi:hypothetical protein, partial [Streptomyces sp. NPDC059597]|uniref:hypothetical protein n=1 Tax=Streptomyces sp. NPDC059597 TaxID=3346879 RepID=UPI0036D15ACD